MTELNTIEWVAGVRIQILALQRDGGGSIRLARTPDEVEFWALYTATGDVIDQPYRQFQHVADFEDYDGAKVAFDAIKTALLLASRFYLKSATALGVLTTLMDSDEVYERWEDAVERLADCAVELENRISGQGARLWPETADWYQSVDLAGEAFANSLSNGHEPEPGTLVDTVIENTTLFTSLED